jgi:hypothetical protein
MNDKVIHYPQYPHGSWLAFWCPGCESVHTIPFINAPPPAPAGLWAYDGDQYAPTVSPSLRRISADGLGSDCHVVITKGLLNYQTDCKHKLAGQAVPMVPWEGMPRK